MKALHLLRSEPDDWVRGLMRELSPDEEVREVSLRHGEVGYDRLIVEIFGSDRVVARW